MLTDLSQNTNRFELKG